MWFWKDTVQGQIASLVQHLLMVFSLAESRGSCEACHIKRDYVYLALQSLHGSIVGAIPQQLNPYPKAPLVNTITRLNVHLLVPLTLDFRDKS